MNIVSSPGPPSTPGSEFPLGSSNIPSDRSSSAALALSTAADTTNDVVIGREASEGVPRMVDRVGIEFEKVMFSFLMQYRSPTGHASYINQIKRLRVFNLSTIFVDFEHFGAFRTETETFEALSAALQDQYYRFFPFLMKALHRAIQEVEPSLLQAPGAFASNSSAASSASETGSGSTPASTRRSAQGTRVFQMAFYNLPLVNRIRDMHTNLIGHLSSISGTVTRTSEVRPELYKATFKCDACQAVVADVEQHFKYTEPTICPTPECGNRTSWTLDITKSVFIDWQKVRIQENPDEIPTGSMPRTLDVIVRGDIVERAKAGDKSLFTGALTVVPDVSQFRIPGIKPMAQRDQRGSTRGEGMNGAVRGLKELGARELSYKMVYIATMVKDFNGGNAEDTVLLADDDDTGEDRVDPLEYIAGLSNEAREELREMAESEHLFANLIRSVAPTVYGHEMIKRGILLQMVGGVHKTTPEGISLRGDINVCIVGDPSTSKSQFLKYVCGFMPRAVYTSGKASSAAGLTAAVVKDEESGEFTIEAGALMLADNGICAIDEFDKMDLRDQVAIHEAMEQQTISIAKAGIHATLNARSSILAAANPVGGRYNHRLGLRQNVNMSAPIMSRFDIFFVVLDECEKNADTRLAEHIVDLHMDGDDAINPPFDTAKMQRYIQLARTFRPQFNAEAQKVLVEYYKELRRADTPTAGARSYRITVRQLESLIRLSEATARLHLNEEITPEFVRQAYNLLRSSTIRVDYGDVNFEEEDASRMSQRTIRRLRNPQNERGRRTERQTASHSRITREEYNNMTNFIVARLGSEEDAEPVHKSTLRNEWLAGQDIESVAVLDAQGKIFDKVVRRMVKQNIIMEILGTSSFIDPSGEDDMEDVGETSYVLHPNTAARQEE